MNTDKTLADVQPGGRVRLGDQAERARFEVWLATQHDQGSEHVMATVGATDDRYQSPVTSSMWSAWQAANSAREGGRINGWQVIDGVRVYSAYAHASILDDQQYVRYEDYLAALSAQPSPGGQDARVQFDAWLEANSIDTTRWGDGEYTDPAAHNYWRAWQAALAARQPVGYSGARTCGDERPCINCYSDQGDCLGPAPSQDSTHQPVLQEPVAWISRIRCVGAEYGKEIYGKLPVQSLNPLYYEHIPLYTAPPAQAVDLGKFVPDPKTVPDCFAEDDSDAQYNSGWNDCRDAVLALIDSKAVGK